MYGNFYDPSRRSVLKSAPSGALSNLTRRPSRVNRARERVHLEPGEYARIHSDVLKNRWGQPLVGSTPTFGTIIAERVIYFVTGKLIVALL